MKIIKCHHTNVHDDQKMCFFIGSAYFLRKGSQSASEESLPSLGSLDLEEDTNNLPMKRKGLLPPIHPIKMETQLPGGINLRYGAANFCFNKGLSMI